jgi:hypothetical protein
VVWIRPPSKPKPINALTPAAAAAATPAAEKPAEEPAQK